MLTLDVHSVVSALNSDVGMAYMLCDGTRIIEFHQIHHDYNEKIPRNEMHYVVTSVRNAIKKGYTIDVLNLSLTCLRSRDVNNIDKYNIGNKSVKESFKYAIKKCSEVCTRKSREYSESQIMYDICHNLAIMACKGNIDNAVIHSMINDSIKLFSNIEKLLTEYEKRMYTKRIMGITKIKTYKTSNLKSRRFAVMKSGNNGVKVHFVTQSKDFAYSEVSRMGVFLDSNRRYVARVCRVLKETNYNPEKLTEEHMKRLGSKNNLLSMTLEMTENGKYDNYYIEIVDYI